MNSVHEQCPKSDSETVMSQELGKKLSQAHRAPNLAQPARTGRAQAAHAWPCRGQPSVVSQAPNGRIVAETLAVSQACMAVSQHRECVPARCATLTPRAPNVCVVSQVQWLYCNVALPISLTLSQYTKVYCDRMPLRH